MTINVPMIATDLLNLSPDAILALAPDGTVLLWSESAARMFGYSSEEAEGRPVHNLLAPAEDVARQQQNLERTIRDGYYVYEAVRRRQDGSLIQVCVSTTAVCGKEDKVLYLLSIEKDVTSLTGEPTCGEFQSNVRKAAHEFNNLLTAINGYSSLALERANPDDRARNYLGEIKKAGDRAANLTRQLLALGRKPHHRVQFKVYLPQLQEENEIGPEAITETVGPDGVRAC